MHSSRSLCHGDAGLGAGSPNALAISTTSLIGQWRSRQEMTDESLAGSDDIPRTCGTSCSNAAAVSESRDRKTTVFPERVAVPTMTRKAPPASKTPRKSAGKKPFASPQQFAGGPAPPRRVYDAAFKLHVVRHALSLPENNRHKPIARMYPGLTPVRSPPADPPARARTPQMSP